MTEFSVGDLTTKGVVVSVEPGGYVGVNVKGTVFSYWPNELQGTGERIDPAELESLLLVFKAYDDASMVMYRLGKLRDKMMDEHRVPVEEAR